MLLAPLPEVRRNPTGSAKNSYTAATPDSIPDDLLEETSDLQRERGCYTSATTCKKCPCLCKNHFYCCHFRWCTWWQHTWWFTLRKHIIYKRKRLLRLCHYLQEMSVASAKTTSTAATQDDVLDDLLEETSNLSNQNNLHQPLEMKAASYEIQSSSLRLSVSRKFWIDFDASSETI